MQTLAQMLREAEMYENAVTFEKYCSSSYCISGHLISHVISYHQLARSGFISGAGGCSPRLKSSVEHFSNNNGKDNHQQNTILNLLYLNNILCSAQHGFLRRRSTSTNLLECFNDSTVCVQSRQQVAIVYIDFAKAFDAVSHKKLSALVYTFGVLGAVVNTKFFSVRTHQTKID